MVMLGRLRELTIDVVESIIVWSGFFVFANAQRPAPEDLMGKLFVFYWNGHNYLHVILKGLED
jgi:hypothetical protein